MQRAFGIIILELHRALEKLICFCSPGIVLLIFHESPSIYFTATLNKYLRRCFLGWAEESYKHKEVHCCLKELSF